MYILQTFYNFLSGYVPGGFFLLPLVAAFLWFVFYTIYKHSGLLPRASYLRGVRFSLIAPSVVYAAAWLVFGPPKTYERIMVLPFSPAATVPATEAWLGRALSGSIEQMLWRLGDRDKVIFRQEWLTGLAGFTPLEDSDSIRARLDRFVKLKYLVSGSYAPDPAGYRLKVVFEDREQRVVLKTVETTVAPAELFTFNRRMAAEARALFDVRKPAQEFKDITASWPAYGEYHLGLTALRSGQDTVAQRHFEKALVLDTALALAHVRLADIARQRAATLKPDDAGRRKLLEGAALRGSRAVRQDAELAEAYTASAWAYVYLERWLEAQTGLEVAYGLQPLNPAVYYLISKMREERFAYFKVKNVYDALEKAIALNPVDVPAYLCLIDLYNNLVQKQERSEQLGRTILEFDPENAAAGLTLSLIYIYQRRYQESITACRKVLAADALKAEAYYNIGISFKGMDRNDSATVYLLKAIDLGYLNAYNHLAEIYDKQKMFYTAIKYLRQRVALGEPNDYFKQSAAARLYSLVHMPGIVVDSNFEFQRLPESPSRDSVTALYEQKRN
jgi:tetratricopeptide (TPR) repeat protein